LLAFLRRQRPEARMISNRTDGGIDPRLEAVEFGRAGLRPCRRDGKGAYASMNWQQAPALATPQCHAHTSQCRRSDHAAKYARIEVGQNIAAGTMPRCSDLTWKVPSSGPHEVWATHGEKQGQRPRSLLFISAPFD